jgi:AcrR family transcriptional regulator
LSTEGTRRQPQQARSTKKRDSVLDAAQQLIYERGYGETTVADIARVSAVTKQNIYQMAAILKALIERRARALDQHGAAYRGATANAGWRATVREGVYSFYELHRADPTLDPLFIAGQDAAETRKLNFDSMSTRVPKAAEEFAAVTHLPNDERMEDFALLLMLGTSAVVRHALRLESCAAQRLLDEHVATLIARLEKMGAK